MEQIGFNGVEDLHAQNQFFFFLSQNRTSAGTSGIQGLAFHFLF